MQPTSCGECIEGRDTISGDASRSSVTLSRKVSGGEQVCRSDDDEKPPPRPRDRYGFFLPGPVKVRPPKPPPEPDPPEPVVQVAEPTPSPPDTPASEPPAPSTPAADEAQVVGLSVIPDSWPPLPPNASLAAEVSWVQSSRLDVVEQLPGGRVRVDLSRACRPAPSRSAIAWLETAISFPAKFADVSVKAAQGTTDEQADVRREKLAIEEVRRLLAEMVDARHEAEAAAVDAG